MEMKDDFEVDAPIGKVWPILTDVERIAPCLPGAQLQEVEGEEFWKAIGQEGQLVGMVCLEPDGEDGEVGHFFVAPDAKRMGVGRMLWQHMEARAGALRVRRLHLDADPFAVPFYEAMGMRVVGEAPSGSIPGRMLPRMEKVLR